MSDKVILITFMYFIHTVNEKCMTKDGQMSTDDFYEKWANVMDDFSEIEGEQFENNV